MNGVYNHPIFAGEPGVHRPMFITFEGTEGGGKTTQMRELAAHLRERGLDVLVTREPGGTYVGDEVRRLLLEKSDETARFSMTPHTELLLFCASRAELVAEVIRPHLAGGGVVLCDRYVDSTYAYQGHGHGLDLTALRAVVDFATGGLMPDLTLFLDITPEEGLRRRAQASLFGEAFNRLDGMDIDFHHRVYDGYQQLIAEQPGRWLRIDAAQSRGTVQAAIREALAAHLPQAAQS